MSAEHRKFEDFELDPNGYRLSRNGEVIRLERIPLEFLCLLVERSGQLVTRDEIVERVWGNGVFIDSEHAINTAVRKIRRALGDDAETPRFIVTVPGRGYRFIAPVVSYGQPEVGENREATVDGDLTSPPSLSAAPGDQQTLKSWRVALLSIAAIALLAGLITIIQRFALNSPMPPASERSKLALSLPSITSIAVLPFANRSGDPQQEYFSDGISEDLIADLSRITNLFVAASTSSFTYKGSSEKAQAIGRELGVKYLVEGSTRCAGEQVRINVRLIEAASGGELWSYRYSAHTRDIFKLQDEVAESLTATLGLQLSMLERGFIVAQRTNSLEAFNYFLLGTEGLLIGSRDALERAHKKFEQSIALDPSYADAYTALGALIAMEFVWQFQSDSHALDRAERMARKAVLLDDSNSNAYAVLAWVTQLKSRPEEAIDDGKRAITLDPGNPFAYLLLADISGLAGDYQAQLSYAQKGMRLDLKHSEFYLFEIGWAYLGMQRYEEAAGALKGAPPNNPLSHIGLIAAYAKLGRKQYTNAEVAELHRFAPKFSLAEWRRRVPEYWSDSPDGRRLFDDLSKAGLK